MDAMGKFQALSNIVKLSHPLLFGIGAVITPVAARALSDGATHLARSVSSRFAMQGLLLLLPFYAFLLLFPSLTLRLFYPTAEAYHGLDNELRIYVLWYLVLYAASVLGAYLAGLERARHHFQAQLIHALGAAVIAVPLTWFTGLTGMLIGGAIAKLILCFAILHYIRRAHRES
jgi:Na+-driven multidrug efflux pump